jgi:hypothetical protein
LAAAFRDVEMIPTGLGGLDAADASASAAAYIAGIAHGAILCAAILVILECTYLRLHRPAVLPECLRPKKQPQYYV